MQVTIGIPFYNAAHTLLNAVRSVLCQSFTDWELLLVDDGSSDHSADIARQIDDPRVRVLADGVNKGLAARLNEIAASANGEYVARMDADDMMHPDRLRVQIAILEDKPSVDVVGTAAYIIDSCNNVNGYREATRCGFDGSAAISSRFLIHPSILGRTAWFRKHPYDASYVRSQDVELWCRSWASSTFVEIPTPLYFYRNDGKLALRKYLLSCRYHRRAIYRYGPQAVGWSKALGLIGYSHCKGIAYALCAPLGSKWLLKRRVAGLSIEEQAAAVEILQRMLNTTVPGVNDKLLPTS